MKNIEFDNPDLAGKLFGFHDVHLKKISKAFGIDIHSRGTNLILKEKEGKPDKNPSEAGKKGKNRSTEAAISLVHDLLVQLYQLLEEGTQLHPSMIDAAAKIMKQDPATRLKSVFSHIICTTDKNRNIIARSPNQLEYANAILSRDIVFSIGPAGTGKTYLAVAMAVNSLLKGDVARIILTRPAVEAGENLGFLPGDLTDKLNPYLRPLYDALYDMLDFEKVRTYIEQEIIEIAPLAFMRGRTLNNAFIILDEAQNTTPEQMKMFLTRMGAASKAIVTGDITQIDLPSGKASGLIQARKILKNISGIAFITFSKEDVVRHPLIADIIEAYEKNNVA